MFHTTIILYDISSDKYLQYVHVGRKASHNVEGFLVGFDLSQYFGCWALLSWYYTSSYVDSFHGERRKRKVEKRENERIFQDVIGIMLRELSVSFSIICI